ncbi:TPA: hypothetical protein PXP39_004275 [Yersinia enterocolitica]|nr:hypothetical protein [Yersinia enterocolitica]HDL7830679.1 hypothetical protein [Yersinia enterocolitica]HDL7834312.1 hypothetical protein [Yersinia enterocolitica]HDL7871535.1 hypothetical protein [Yersinia enterocolitica]HDL7875177.1 hypothetical protein [Yersinia enterocolitica]
MLNSVESHKESYKKQTMEDNNYNDAIKKLKKDGFSDKNFVYIEEHQIDIHDIINLNVKSLREYLLCDIEWNTGDISNFPQTYINLVHEKEDLVEYHLDKLYGLSHEEYNKVKPYSYDYNGDIAVAKLARNMLLVKYGASDSLLKLANEDYESYDNIYLGLLHDKSHKDIIDKLNKLSERDINNAEYFDFVTSGDKKNNIALPTSNGEIERLQALLRLQVHTKEYDSLSPRMISFLEHDIVSMANPLLKSADEFTNNRHQSEQLNAELGPDCSLLSVQMCSDFERSGDHCPWHSSQINITAQSMINLLA